MELHTISALKWHLTIFCRWCHYLYILAGGLPQSTRNRNVWQILEVLVASIYPGYNLAGISLSIRTFIAHQQCYPTLFGQSSDILVCLAACHPSNEQILFPKFLHPGIFVAFNHFSRWSFHEQTIKPNVQSYVSQIASNTVLLILCGSSSSIVFLTFITIGNQHFRKISLREQAILSKQVSKLSKTHRHCMTAVSIITLGDEVSKLRRHWQLRVVLEFINVALSHHLVGFLIVRKWYSRKPLPVRHIWKCTLVMLLKLTLTDRCHVIGEV